MIKNYDDKIDNRLLKTKDVTKEYPLLTQYSLAKAVQDKKLCYTKVGNTNYFRVQDIENFINSGKQGTSD
ncbi:MAG: hypothetical protein J6B98_06365 [Bacilli bacterium]|nr:hypothetical protein [Bacilli bacterium]